MIPPPDLQLALPEAMLEREAVAWAAEALVPLFGDGPHPGWGLYLASRNAGTATALHFWSEAMRTGVGLANPELFPWCLANAPAGALARRFGFSGPNTTWLGGAEALEAAHQAARVAIHDASIAGAAVVLLDFHDLSPAASCDQGKGEPGRLLAWQLTLL